MCRTAPAFFKSILLQVEQILEEGGDDQGLEDGDAESGRQPLPPDEVEDQWKLSMAMLTEEEQVRTLRRSSS